MNNKIFLFTLFILYSNFLNAQHLNPDSVFLEFERCVEGYLKTNYIHDSAYVCYYGSKYNYGIKKRELGDGGIFYSDWPSLPAPIDSNMSVIDRRTPFFYRELSFMDFVNMILSQVKNVDCKLPILNGTLFFVNCPSETWEQFYLDEIVFDDKLRLTPSIDIIRSNNSEKYYRRELLVCEYSRKEGFKVDTAILVRESKNCK